HGNEQQQDPGQLSSQQNHHRGGKHEGEKLLQEFRQYRRHGELHSFDVVDDGRKQGAGRVPGEKRRRTSQDVVIQIVAQVGDHSKTCVVDEVGSNVVEDPL